MTGVWMSRNGDIVSQLPGSGPELKSAYQDSYGGSGGHMGPTYQITPRGSENRVQLPDIRQHSSSNNDSSKLDQLEKRVQRQEVNAHDLLERALRIKEDVMENLNLTHNSWQGEMKQRQLLQDHIRSVTDLIKQMDRDIQMLNQQLQSHQASEVSTIRAIQNLELQQVSAFTDLKGRVAQCDTAVAKLATDQKEWQISLKQLSQQNSEATQRLNDKLQALEVKIAKSAGQRSNEKLSSSGKEPSQSHELLEVKLRSAYDELKQQIRFSEKKNEKEQENMNVKMEQQTLKLQAANDLLDKIQVEMAKQRCECPDRITKEINDIKSHEKSLEDRLVAMVTAARQQQLSDLTALKMECRSGFSAVHESLSHSKSLLEGKICLSEEALRKQLQHISKMILLV